MGNGALPRGGYRAHPRLYQAPIRLRIGNIFRFCLKPNQLAQIGTALGREFTYQLITLVAQRDQREP